MREEPELRSAPDAAPRFDDPAVERWLDAARGGEVGAFEQLYRLYAGRVYALCLRLAGDAGEAEELAQDAFVRAWERLGSFRGESAFSSWLHRLTVNVVLGTWRSRGRERKRLVAIDDWARADESDEPRELPLAAPAGPEGSRLDLERAIAGLPRGARAVFVLHDVEGYRHREIADLTGLATGTSKAQLHRARRLLREALS